MILAQRIQGQRRRLLCCLTACVGLVILAAPAAAQTFDTLLPRDAEQVQSSGPAAGGHSLATAPWSGAEVPTRTLTGAVLRETWRIPQPEQSVQERAAAFAGAIEASGFDVLLQCHAATCGGFDFTARMDLGPSPEMFVDFGDFSYISATIPEAETGIAVTISRSGPAQFVHAVQIAPRGPDAVTTLNARDLSQSSSTGSAADSDVPALIQRLPELGAVTLDDLSFRTGASELSGRDYPSLVALAAFLADNRDRRIMLVGHTDSEGSLDSNVRLSEARANAVRTHLVEQMDVDPARIEATGIGFLAPRASNDTAPGREANRRVEAVLLGGP